MRNMIKIAMAAVVLLTTGCAAMMHDPDVTTSSAALQTEGICALNVVKEVSIFDPVVLKACAKGPDELSMLFGTMHNETAEPANWRVRVYAPGGALILDADKLDGPVRVGQCGTGGCSKEALFKLRLPQPWAKGSYVIECTSKLPPVLNVTFNITVT